MSAVWVIDVRKLRWWGKERGWYTMGEIALGLDIAPSTLSRATRGKSVPGHELMAAVRLVMGPEAFADIFSVSDADDDSAVSL
jgi:hypothetical protein